MQKSLLIKEIAAFFRDHGRVSFKESQGCDFVMCSLAFKSEEQIFTAHGQEKNRDEAAFKCVMEAVERFVVNAGLINKYSKYGALLGNSVSLQELESLFPYSKNWIGSSTNGVAAHTSHSQAKEAAINELIERHVVLKSLSQRIYPLELESSEASLKFYGWKGPLGRFVVVARGILKGRCVYGLGCHKKLEEAKTKALAEVSPRLSLLQKSKSADLKVMSMSKNFLFHWYDDSTETDNFFNDSAINMPNVDTHIKRSDIWTGNYTLNKELSGLGLSVVKAVSPRMQNLFFGEWSPDKLNPVAIPLSTKLPQELHMIG